MPVDLFPVLCISRYGLSDLIFVSLHISMSLYTASLNSGSNGNCYYIGNEQDAVLVDAGLSCKETEKRMERIGLSMDKVRAIFVSHEHSDHIAGLRVLSKKYRLPVYITPNTLLNSRLFLDTARVCPFTAHAPVQIGELKITAFPKFHDAIDPHSFIIEGAGVAIGVLTDIGVNCEHVNTYFNQCHAVYLEANYDEDMLANGNYPFHLKRRISGDKGHMSNAQALNLFNTHRPSFMSHVFLSHLSKDNNHPDLARELFERHAGNTRIVVASRYGETEVYCVGKDHVGTVMPQVAAIQQVAVAAQMSLF
jgi:phosphoribosyl 1,2-cyclic phosphodiesterase